MPKTVSGRLFEDSSGRQLETLTFSPDGSRLAASTWGNSIILWDVKKGDVVAAVDEGVGTGWTDGRCILEFTPDENTS